MSAPKKSVTPADEIRWKEMRIHLSQAEDDLMYLEECRKKLKNIQKNRKILSDYYHSDLWMEDRTKAKSEDYYPLFTEDGIWNTLTDQHDREIDIIQLLVTTLKSH